MFQAGTQVQTDTYDARLPDENFSISNGTLTPPLAADLRARTVTDYDN